MATNPIVPPAEMARKFLDLIEQNRAHLAELYDTGRWKLYYSDEELCARARELVALRDKWSAVAALGGNGLPALRRWQTEATAVPAMPAADAI
jgi:hypothetical protein